MPKSLLVLVLDPAPTPLALLASYDTVNPHVEVQAGYDSDDSFMAYLDTMPLLNDPPDLVDMLVDDVKPIYPTSRDWILHIGGDIFIPNNMVISPNPLDIFLSKEAQPLALAGLTLDMR